MADKRRKRPTDKAFKAGALSRWEGEGGAPVEGRKPKRPRLPSQPAKLTVDPVTDEAPDKPPPVQTSKTNKASASRLFPSPPAEKDEGFRGSVPFMITAAQRETLLELGYSQDEIRNMTPDQAHQLIEAGNEAAN